VGCLLPRSYKLDQALLRTDSGKWAATLYWHVCFLGGSAILICLEVRPVFFCLEESGLLWRNLAEHLTWCKVHFVSQFCSQMVHLSQHLLSYWVTRNANPDTRSQYYDEVDCCPGDMEANLTRIVPMKELSTSSRSKMVNWINPLMPIIYQSQSSPFKTEKPLVSQAIEELGFCSDIALDCDNLFSNT